jgi:RNA polymerase sigma-70 factor (ECF subfamily)
MDLDKYLVSIAAGDAHAFGTWASLAEEPLRRSLRSFASIVDTEAVLQEGLLRVWQVAPRVVEDGQGNSLLRMAMRIVRNAAIDAARRNRRQISEDPLESSPKVSVAPVEPDPWLREAIHQCRELLPDRTRLVLRLRLEAAGDRPDRVLAEEADMTLNTFLKNFGRARRALGECLDKKGVDWQRGLR